MEERGERWRPRILEERPTSRRNAMEKGGSVGYEGSEKMQQKAGFFGTRKPAVEEDKEVVVLHICDPVRICLLSL